MVVVRRFAGVWGRWIVEPNPVTRPVERWEFDDCPFCGHGHGHGADPGERLIHRVSHCWLPKPPWGHSYCLVLPDGLEAVVNPNHPHMVTT